MNTNLKKILLVFGGGFLLYYAFKTIRPFGGSTKIAKSSAPSKEANFVSSDDKKNAMTVLQAYKSAQRAGESKDFLDEMNLEFAKEYSLKVYRDKGTGKYFVADLNGTKII